MDSSKNIPIEQARELAQIISKQYNIKNHKDWLAFIKGTPVKEFLSFEEARKFVRKLKIKNLEGWEKYCLDECHHFIQGIPSHPAKQYKNEWVSWGDFLGGEHKVPSKFMSFEEAVGIVRTLGFESCKDWQKFCDSGEKPKDIPHSPQKIYKDEWMGWNYFLGIGLYRHEFYGDIPPDEIKETIESEIIWDLNQIDMMLEIYREQYKTDEEIIEACKDEPELFIEGLKKCLKKYPRCEGEE